VAISDDLLEPYLQADTTVDAERVLDDLLAHGADLPFPIGDLYDELAEAAAEEDDYDLAARLERKALDAGCTRPVIGREMLGWYLLKSGALEQGEGVFRELRAERPDDVDIVLTLGHARSDAGLLDSALGAFDEALGVAKSAGLARVLDRARIERKAEREEAGLPPDEDDRFAPLPRPMATGPIAWTLAWFPPTERAAAVARWPELAADFEHPGGYSRRIEESLRRLRSALGQRPSVAPIVVEALVDWAATEGHDPASGEARSEYAATLASSGGAISWPPGRNDACWCRSGRKYKRCCGRD
jgi:tetratricopeptide (TPR) repeat protein